MDELLCLLVQRGDYVDPDDPVVDAAHQLVGYQRWAEDIDSSVDRVDRADRLEQLGRRELRRKE